MGGGASSPFLIPPLRRVSRWRDQFPAEPFSFFLGNRVLCACDRDTFRRRRRKRQPGERKRETFFLPLPPVSSSVSRQFGPNSLNFFFPLPLSIPPPSDLRNSKGGKNAVGFLFSFLHVPFALSYAFRNFFFTPLEKDLSGWNIRRSKVSSLPYFKRTRLQICSRNNAARHNPPGMFGIAKKD